MYQQEQMIGQINNTTSKTKQVENRLLNAQDAKLNPEMQIEAVSDLEKRYMKCLNTIFGWAVFRKKDAKERKSLNLDQMKQFSKLFGDPHKGNFKIIHIAGTNGKGSCSIKTATALQKLGFKTGLFTSPHISTFRERIQINGQMISMERIVQICERIFEEVQRANLDVRFFEVVTMVGLIEFAEQGCDYVVLECGLGATLDATNIVEYPDVVCSAITSIGKDHMDVLGNNLEEIALEKSGCIKKGVPGIVGPSCIAPDLVSIKNRAKDEGVDLIEVPSMNSFIQENNEVACQIIRTVCDVEKLKYDDCLNSLIGVTAQPCRFQRIQGRKETIILDVCHNIDGFQAVIEQVKCQYPSVEKLTIVFGISKGKKLDDILALLDGEKLVQDLYLVSRPHMRLHTPHAAHQMVAETGSKKLRGLVTQNDVITSTNSDSNSDGKQSSNSGDTQNNNVSATLDSLVKDPENVFMPCMNEEAGQPKQLLLICGSFFIMQDVRQYFGYKQEIDYE